MAWDRHGNYSRSIRDGTKVRRVYLGRGPAAQLAALLDDQRRADRLARDEAWRAEEARWATAEARLGELCELSESLARAALLAAGYHQHDRGAWRRRRMHGDDAMNGMDLDTGNIEVDGVATIPDEAPTHGGGPPPIQGQGLGDRPLTEGELRELLGRAGQGDRTVLPALRRLLDAAPDLWRHCGDVARTAEAAWIDLIAGRDLLVRESLTRKVAALKAELARPDAPLLERLLAERVTACWVQAAQADAAFAGLKGTGVTAAQLDLLQRRQERTQRSYLASIRTLATVRRLIAPGQATTTADTPRAAEATDHPTRDEAGRDGRPERNGAGTSGGDAKEHRRRRKSASEGRETTVPKALRDRMRGLVEAEN
jgi:hypothetical protein